MAAKMNSEKNTTVKPGYSLYIKSNKVKSRIASIIVPKPKIST